MPKKMGINSKAVEARERKADAKKVATEKAAKAAEDALWKDDDKQLAKKKKQKEEEERKRLEQARKKAEAKELLEKEMNSIKVAPKVSVQKVTRSQIEAEVEKRNRAIETVNNPPKVVPAKVVPLEENLNRVMADTEVAQTIDQALAVLAVKDGEDKHPEKRMKAAYKAFEEEQLPILKQEHPSLKLSQLKQMIFKDWQKSPQNPLNQAKV
uniref:Putative coiled-coil domain-containing protein n=1 Tax=Culex tarsalis TaxID=7177 RepID=A0A1Q3FBK1_CULTA